MLYVCLVFWYCFILSIYCEDKTELFYCFSISLQDSEPFFFIAVLELDYGYCFTFLSGVSVGFQL